MKRKRSRSPRGRLDAAVLNVRVARWLGRLVWRMWIPAPRRSR